MIYFQRFSFNFTFTIRRNLVFRYLDRDLDFQRHMSWYFYVQLRWEIIVCFVVIGGIDDHRYLEVTVSFRSRYRKTRFRLIVNVKLNGSNGKIYSRWRYGFHQAYSDHWQATGKLYHLRLRVECTLFVIYKAGREPTPYWW
jgi:hypothetical protein